ncbi:MAG: CPBP family intramembrane metalloprotease [Comamonadaceae bacterium]|nr:CPBP family intramembrane metalloprotease [Comamonadaceae bacterium]
MMPTGCFQRSPLLGFLALTFAWSWACWWLSPAVKLQSPWLATMLMFAGGFGPSVAAVVVVWCTRGRVGLHAWFSRYLTRNVGWGWIALAFFAPLVVVLIAAGLHLALGGTLAPSSAVEHVPLAVMNLLAVLLLGGPLGEEFGWRGYALPTLQVRMSWRLASLVLGLVWGVWHLPLLFISDTVQAHMTLVHFLVSAVAMSVIFAWLALHTGGSVAVALVLHTAINFWPTIVPVLPTPQNSRPYALVVLIQVLLAAGLLVCRTEPV